MQKTKKFYMQAEQGSVLAYSLIVLAIMITIAATMSIATMIEKKSASSTDFSVQAYQTADSGIQLAIKEIENKPSGTINDLFGASDCNGGLIQDQDLIADSPAGGLFNLSFYDASNDKMACDSAISLIASIKSVGTFNNTVRAVQVSWKK